ncbi:hypothetical protein [Solimonas sp. SE-A11]|uniref:hypothetical protein n=1 Tax=Solimonas sp. SE-A11 TaxID=3054954 RepID=UPI00259CE453|nr:hypothetical protein [Solimonas sp. SE-A11]MDM4771799.1 hypothetical protein [Solimonas sp. SE-A11]
MADGSHYAGYTRYEAAELEAAFERVREQLPVMFRSFWHRAEIPSGKPALFRIHAEDGSPVLQLERIDTGRYRSVGLCRGRRIVFANCCPSIDDALRAAGLL